MSWRRPSSFQPGIRRALNWAGFLFSAYCTAKLFDYYLIEFTPTQGPSMMPTMPERGSISIVSRWYKKGYGLKIGDIVTAEHPMFLGNWVGKRIVGMPGDYVIRDADASPTIGGAPVPGIIDENGTRKEPMIIQVPEGHVWLAGDNLAWSRDSRMYGPLPMALIRGKLIASYIPPFNLTWLGGESMNPADGEESLDTKIKKAQELERQKLERRRLAVETQRKRELEKVRAATLKANS